ncbi:MAG: TlpA disulfide reductase family protein [Flavobacteriales bacterium]
MMNRPLILLTAATITFAACTGGNGARTVELTVEGAGGKTAYFDRFENNLPYRVDSVKLDGAGKGTMHVKALPLDFYRIALDNEQLIVALDSAESLVVEAKTGALGTSAKIQGSTYTDSLHSFYADSRAFEERTGALRAKLAADRSDTAAMQQLNAANAAFYDRCKAFVTANSASPAALTAISKLDIAKEMPLFKRVRDDLRKVMPRSGFFAMYRDQVDRLEQQEIAMKAQEEEMKRLSNLLPVGSVAPEIRQNTPEGGTFALSELRGKVVLIDFWASWCRPCRMENPNVKRVYEKYHNKGFEILGVSLDRAQDAWVAAIQQDGLPWKHVSDLGYWNNAAAQEYGVSSIPFTVLVDREGKIIDKGLRSEQLEGKLAELLGK